MSDQLTNSFNTAVLFFESDIEGILENSMFGTKGYLCEVQYTSDNDAASLKAIVVHVRAKDFEDSVKFDEFNTNLCKSIHDRAKVLHEILAKKHNIDLANQFFGNHIDVYVIALDGTKVMNKVNTKLYIPQPENSV